MIGEWSDRAATIPRQPRASDPQTRRLLVQLALDFHDGPLQDVAALLGELRLYRSQLGAALDSRPDAHLVLGRLDDLEARVLGLDASLRGFVDVTELAPPARPVLRRRLVESVRDFEQETGLRPLLEVSGNLELVRGPQRETLARVVHEALTNARKHSSAETVRVAVRRTANWTLAEVVDDGVGFDVEETVLRAARDRRFGLVGMAERVRMLDGRFEVQSRPGGPTRIAVALPDHTEGGP